MDFLSILLFGASDLSALETRLYFCSPLFLAFLENGQYDSAWSQIHMFPSQTLQAATDLKTQILMPIHNSKYRISYHAWNAPLRDITKIYENSNFDFTLITPKIGQIISLPLDKIKFKNEKWWE